MQTKSFLLDTELWDLQLDNKGDIAITQNPYAVAQDVASACMTVFGECYYDETLGIPYFDKVFGTRIGTQYVASKLQSEALKLDYVLDAVATVIPHKTQRRMTGVIAITDTNHEQITVEL